MIDLTDRDGPKLEALDRHLTCTRVTGILRIPANAHQGALYTRVQPHLWRRAGLYDGSIRMPDRVNLEQEAEVSQPALRRRRRIG